MSRRPRWERAAIATALAGAFALNLVVLAASDWSVIRASGFGHSNTCLHGLMERDTGLRSVVIVGSSRVRANIDPDAIAAALGVKPQAAVNVGHPERELALDVGIVRHFSARAPIRTAVVELYVASDAVAAAERLLDPGDPVPPLGLASGDYSDRHLITSRYRELLDRLPPGMSVANAYDATMLAFRKIELTIKVIHERRWVHILGIRDIDEGIDPARTNICALRPEVVDAAEAAGVAQRAAFARRFAPAMDRGDPSDFLTSPARRADRASVDAIVQLGHERGFSSVFVYLPAMYTPLPDPAFQQVFRRRFGAPLIVPDRALHAALSVDGYSDSAHLNAHGLARMSAWLVPRIRAASAKQR